MKLTQKLIDKIQEAMLHTNLKGEINWKDGDDCVVVPGIKTEDIDKHFSKGFTTPWPVSCPGQQNMLSERCRRCDRSCD